MMTSMSASRQHGKVRGQSQTPIEKGMMVENARLGAAVRIGTAVAAGIRKLQTDQQAVVGAGGQAMLFDQCGAQAGQAFLACARPPPTDWDWHAPSWETATASPPQINFAPLRPKRCQRRIVCSDGLPSGKPSQPSMGCTTMRLPILMSPRTRGWRNGDSVPVRSS